MTTDKQIPSHLRITLESISIFSEDGKIKIDDLNKLLSIAEEDGQIDNEEALALSNVLKSALTADVDSATIKRIQNISEIIMKRDH